MERIRRIHRESRETYGVPRVHAELLIAKRYAARCPRAAARAVNAFARELLMPEKW